MAYHEYTSTDGRLVRRSYGGKHYPTLPDLQVGVLESIFEGAHPDSLLWTNAARQAMKDLQWLIGDANYLDWTELVWPGETLTDLTWREICEQTEKTYRVALLRQVLDVKVLAEAAKSILAENRAKGTKGA